MSRALSAPVDVRSARLVKVVNAVVLHDDPAPAVAKRLRALARAARLFVEAHHLARAKDVLTALEQYVMEAAAADQIGTENALAIERVAASLKAVH